MTAPRQERGRLVWDTEGQVAGANEEESLGSEVRGTGRAHHLWSLINQGREVGLILGVMRRHGCF